MKTLNIGTAGHIDHGKSSLVQALSGLHPDQLPEEKKRGITIDLGFVPWQISPEQTIHFIDVPGHEKFVRTMIAGASGIHMALLVVAADDGVMPQTREHFDILRLLNVEIGRVIITKSDLSDPELLELLEEEISELEAEMSMASTSNNKELLFEEVADVLFSAANVARKLDIDPEAALRYGNKKFEKRFKFVEDKLSACGKEPKNASLREMETYWQEAKGRT